MSHADARASSPGSPSTPRTVRPTCVSTSRPAPSVQGWSPRSPAYAVVPAPTPLVPPPAGLRSQVLAQVAVGAPAPGVAARRRRAGSPPPPYPCGWPGWPPRSPSSPESASGASAPGRSRPPRRSTLRWTPGPWSPRPPSPPSTATPTRGEASAVETDDTFTIRVSASELGDEPGLHEVWLINVDGKRMISIGLLASGDEGEFAVPMRPRRRGLPHRRHLGRARRRRPRPLRGEPRARRARLTPHRDGRSSTTRRGRARNGS